MKLLILFAAILLTQLFVSELIAQSSAVFPIAQLPGDNHNPDFCESDFGAWHDVHQKLWFAWDAGNHLGKNIYVRYYRDEQWHTETPVASDSMIHQNPDIECFGDSALVVWESQKNHTFQIAYSLYDGNFWLTPAYITRDTLHHQNPALYTYKTRQGIGQALLVWEQGAKIYWSEFVDDIWRSPDFVPSSCDSIKNPAFGKMSPYPFLVFEGFKGSNWDIYATWFVPDSNSWIRPVRLTFDAGEDRNPQIGWDFLYYSQQSKTFWGSALIFWQTNRNLNWDIYRGIYNVADGPTLNHVRRVTYENTDDTKPVAKFVWFGDVGDAVVAWQSKVEARNNIHMTFDTFPDKQVNEMATSNAKPAFSRFTGNSFWTAWESLREKRKEIWGVSLQGIFSDIKNDKIEVLPESFSLLQNYPNPFNSGTIIEYVLSKPGYVELAIFDIKGQKVKVLVKQHMPPGNYKAVWNGADSENNLLHSGVYFIRLTVGNFVQIRKAVLAK